MHDDVERLQCTKYNPMVVARLFGLVPLFSAALCAVTALDAHASEPVSLRWSAPANCPSGDDVLAEVNRLLGARAPSEQTTLDVVAEVKRKDNGTYLVRLEIPGADGPRVREVSAVSCAALGPAAALILAMMVDPEAALTASPAPDSPGPTSPAQASFSATRRAPNPVALSLLRPLPTMTAWTIHALEKKAPAARRPTFAFTGQLLVDVGSLPGPAFGASGALGIFPGRGRFEAGVLHLLEQESPFPTLSKAGSNVNLTAFHAAGGYAFMVNPDIEFIPRVRLDAGQFNASSYGVSDVGEGSATFVGLGLGALFSIRLSEYLRFGFGLEGLKLLAYPQFIVTGVGVVHQPEPFVGRLSLGLEVRR